MWLRPYSQVPNSLSNDPMAEIMAHETTGALGTAPIVPSVKNFEVIGSLKLDSKQIIRRLSVDLCINKLSDWKENAAIHFYRFLHSKQFYFSYTDVEGHSSTIDSDGNLEAVLRLHQQRLSAIENSSLLPLELQLEIAKGSSTTDPPKMFETFVRQDCGNVKDLATCDCVACGKTVTMGLAYKCLHCNNVYICDSCRETDERHSLHLLMSCLVLILGTEHNCIGQDYGLKIKKLTDEDHDNGK